MTVCSGILPPLMAWTIWGILLAIVSISIYLLFRRKIKTSIKIIGLILGIVLLLIIPIFLVNTCYSKPEILKDFNREITSREQAIEILKPLISEELRNRGEVITYTGARVTDNESIIEGMINRSIQNMYETESRYFKSGRFNISGPRRYIISGSLYTYTLMKDGKLYKRRLSLP